MSVDSLTWFNQPLQPNRPLPGSQSQPGLHSHPQPQSDSGTGTATGTDSQNTTLAGTPPSNLVHFPFGTKTGLPHTTTATTAKTQWPGSEHGRNRSRETVHTHPYGSVYTQDDPAEARSQSRTSFLGSLRADLTKRAARIVTNMRSRIRSNRWPPRHRTLSIPTLSVVWRPCHFADVEREDGDAFPP
ncbi:hypothetical protein CONPUDRAFT_154877 [Coniophora puteana RWD-64-598 SS2]|uniref:Uncharacterized protein n=1 Tax=Coniophora puteana (strain RWD-64-598) TaxID=741705 RepID=A0A5M3MLK9_CONPW|nr:uncharacterized protein CONPUDRAFT_154877 [Coniophora puteana RWD-64-598 SS2]EIW79461.1 hypothetical protein CONPUDRAFT_154877 [Coniophora puteana RWD-64-598 SS2]